MENRSRSQAYNRGFEPQPSDSGVNTLTSRPQGLPFRLGLWPRPHTAPQWLCSLPYPVFSGTISWVCVAHMQTRLRGDGSRGPVLPQPRLVRASAPPAVLGTVPGDQQAWPQPLPMVSVQPVQPWWQEPGSVTKGARDLPTADPEGHLAGPPRLQPGAWLSPSGLAQGHSGNFFPPN